ncbi:hypothetical protein H0901_12980 [Microcystis aeruginosa BLCCF158]|uniref:Uncharacterized protein n=1 Tax=Microcystis aeruginosa BLCC-F158 TaxID=2755316 RepID=A0A841V570_MICAE|nr:hypothetical protein [Microcystis aeruginosa]MBC1196150.1 hypothetical protein [Microcystis aeruginosa BLCC-F158]
MYLTSLGNAIDKVQKPVAVQIPIAEFEKIEEILEDYVLRKLIEKVENDQILDKKHSNTARIYCKIYFIEVYKKIV